MSSPEDTPIGVALSGSDPNDDALTFSVVTAPSHGSLSGAGSSRTYTPDAHYNGPDTFTYQASDGNLLSPVVTVSITVTPVNDRPSLAAISAQTISEMVAFSLVLVGSDIDGDSPLTYSLSSGPEGLAVVPSTGALAWTPTESQGPGSYPVSVVVADPDGLTAPRAFTITVTEVNRDPVLAAITDRTVFSGDPLMLTASASDPDLPANTLSYGLVSTPAGATIDPVTGSFNWTANVAAADYPVTVAVSDGHGGSAQTSFTIHVVRRATSLELGGSTVAQHSDRATITARLTSGSLALASQQVTLRFGSQSATVTTDSSGLASATFAINGPEGVLPTSASFAGTQSHSPSTDADTFSVLREDATLQYSGDTIGLVGAPLTLAATFTDSAASGYAGANAESGAGATIGDISKARVVFEVFSAASCMSGTPLATIPAAVVDTGVAGDGTGSAQASWSTATEGSFCIVVSLVATTGSGHNAYYTAPPAMAGALAVFADTVGKVTGGGCIKVGSTRQLRVQRDRDRDQDAGQLHLRRPHDLRRHPCDVARQVELDRGSENVGNGIPDHIHTDGQGNVEVRFDDQRIDALRIRLSDIHGDGHQRGLGEDSRFVRGAGRGQDGCRGRQPPTHSVELRQHRRPHQVAALRLLQRVGDNDQLRLINMQACREEASARHRRPSPRHAA